MARTRHLIVEHLKPAFKKHGYKFKSGYYFSFVRKEGEHIYSVGFSMGTKYQIMYGGNMSIADLRVERIILEVGLPNMDLTTYHQGKDQLFTVSDKSEAALSMSGNRLNTEELAIDFAEKVVRYLDDHGWAFADHYSHLSNVLTQMNQLTEAGKYWHEILAGGPDYLFRGLLISKLCDDPLFDDKIKYVDEIFYNTENKVQDWIPNYEYLKKRLTNLLSE